MSVLVVGASHRSASIELLERLAAGDADATKLAIEAVASNHVREAAVVATCNRLEMYAEVDRFHAGVEDLTSILVRKSGLQAHDVLPSLYVHYDESVVAHLFDVACGLDSMVVGESQILGQVRAALRRGQDDATIGPSLNALFQHGLRVGKRAHSETAIDAAGRSVVSVALSEASVAVPSWPDARVCIVGAGSVAALTANALRRLGASDIVIVSRTAANAARLARSIGGQSATMDELGHHLTNCDVLVCCTGSTAPVVSIAMIRAALAGRHDGARYAIVDLALPHDVETGVSDLPGVTLIELQTVADVVQSDVGRSDVEAVRSIVDDEVAAYTRSLDATRVAPTVVALRMMATAVVSTELERLWSRVDDLSPAQMAEISQAINRVADKLLHEPTVRIKELAGRSPASTYADALAELFSLDSMSVEALIKPGDHP